MFSQLFSNVFSQTTTSIDPMMFFASTLVSLGLGWFSAMVYRYKTIYNKTFVVTLAMLPAIVQVVIFLVNGNLGTSIAIMGAFGLIRFRSAPGGAKELVAIFMAMTIGLATGMGYLAFAVLFTIIMGIVSLGYEQIGFGDMKKQLRQLTITIPENLDYEDAFEDIFSEKTQHVELESVKTSDMGSLFKLKYIIQLKESVTEKQLIDALRVRNGNLEININRKITKENEL